MITRLLLSLLTLVVVGQTTAVAAVTRFGDFDVDVEFFAGQGSQTALILIDWHFPEFGPDGQPISTYTSRTHAFGYRWDGDAPTAGDALLDLAAEDGPGGLTAEVEFFGLFGSFALQDVDYEDASPGEAEFHEAVQVNNFGNFLLGFNFDGQSFPTANQFSEPQPEGFTFAGIDAPLQDGMFYIINYLGPTFPSPAGLGAFSPEPILTASPAPIIPEPSSWLVMVGLCGLAGRLRRTGQGRS